MGLELSVSLKSAVCLGKHAEQESSVGTQKTLDLTWPSADRCTYIIITRKLNYTRVKNPRHKGVVEKTVLLTYLY